MDLQTATIENFCLHRSELAAYIDGELPPREELELESHLSMCKSCATELNEQKHLLRALDFALEAEREIELPENFAKVIVANAESKVSGLRRPQERSKALIICAALAALALLVLGAETETVFSAFVQVGEKCLAVGGFVARLIYDAATGAGVVLRSLGSQFVFSPIVFIAFTAAFAASSLFALSRFINRSQRS